MNKKYNHFGYWIFIAHLNNWTYNDINSLIIKVIHSFQLQWEDFFALTPQEWVNKLELAQQEIDTLQEQSSKLVSSSFYAEDLLSQGFKILPINAAQYPKSAKRNLGKRFAPPVLYAKGNLSLLNTPTVAISDNLNPVGPFDAKKLLHDTLVISPQQKHHIEIFQEVLAQGGQVILVLPCGIKKYTDSYKKYYKNILSGKLLICSQFFPDNLETVQSIEIHQMLIKGMADRIEVI